MLTSINPLGERGRGHQWGLTVTLYTLASILGGAATGLVLGAVGDLLPVPLRLAAALLLVAAAVDLLVLRTRRRLPSGRRQVDEDWLTRYRAWVYATGFGFQLGTGVVTIVTSTATYAWLLLLLALGLPGAVLTGVVFGLVRAVPVLLGRRADSPERLRQLARRLDAQRSGASRLTIGVLTAGALVLALA